MPRRGSGVALLVLAAALLPVVAGCSGGRKPDSPAVPGSGMAPTVRPLPAPPACQGRAVRVREDIQAAIDAAGPNRRLCLGAGVHRLKRPLRPRAGQWIGGRGAILSGARPLERWTRDGPGRWHHPGITRDPVRLVGECADSTIACLYPDDVWRDGTRLKRGAVV